jgi:hypothetical protein
MRKLEKNVAVQPQLERLQNRLQGLQKDYNSLLTTRKSQETLLAKLQDEAKRLSLAAQADNQAAEVYRTMQERYQQLLHELEAEEYTSRSLEAMQYNRTRALAECDLPLAELRAQLEKTKTLQSGAEGNLQRWTRGLKEAKERGQVLKTAVEAQHSSRMRRKGEEIDNARKRKEFEICTEMHRERSAASHRVLENEETVILLQESQRKASALEEIAEELTQHQAYISRQEGHLTRLRKVFPMEKAEEAEQYLEHLQHTEATLQEFAQQLCENTAAARDLLRSLNRELDLARGEDRPDPPKRIDLEQRLRDKEMELDMTVMKAEQRETAVAQACEIVTRLLRQTTESPMEVAALAPGDLVPAVDRLARQLETYLLPSMF